MTPTTPLPLVMGYMLLLGLGIGLVLQVLVIAVQNAVEIADLGVATSSNTFFRSLGGAFGTAVFGAVLSATLASNLTKFLSPADLAGVPIAQLTSSPQLISQLSPAVKAGVIHSFSDSITLGFLVAVPIAVAAFLLVLLLPELPLRETAAVGVAHTPDDPAGDVLAEPVI
jgi:hypothetical protein